MAPRVWLVRAPRSARSCVPSATLIAPLNRHPLRPHHAPADGVTGVTAWPSALTVAMTWDPEAAYEFGQGMAVEQRIKGACVRGLTMPSIILGSGTIMSTRTVF